MRRIWFFSFLPLALVTSASASTDDLARRYTLSGIAATGGELKLEADGSYDWSVSDDGANRSSSGKWEKRGALVTLKPDDAENPSGIARVVRIERWGDEAERLYLSQNWPKAWEEATKRCALLAVRFRPEDVAGLPVPSSPKIAAAEAVEAQRAAVAAIARWDKAGVNDPQRAAYLNTATTALMVHFAASRLSTEVHERFGVAQPGEELITFPARCTPPRFMRPTDPLPAERHPHVGIIVGDPQFYATIMGTRVTIAYADGARKEAVTGPGGMAMVPVDPARSVVAVTLSLDEASGAVTVPTAIQGAGVAVIDVNPNAMALRSLEPRTLKPAKDGSLHPQDGIAGAYLPQ